MTTDRYYWDLGLYIGLPIAAIILIAFIIGATLFARIAIRENYERLWNGGWATVLTIGALATIGVTLGVTYPWEARYHQWREVVGEVQSVDSRLISTGDGMEERYVVTIKGQPYGIDDTRAATLEPGDTVSLMCKAEWQYGAASGYGCRWGGEVINR